MDKYIPINEPLLNGNEKKYLCECIDSGWISSEGPFVKRFEREMADYVGRKYGIAVSSGTAALETAVQALNLPLKSEVIMPAFTIISCAQAITKAGLIPVVVDCREDTWNIDVDQIEKRITDKTSAIMLVHIYGITVDVEPVLKLARKYGLKIIEDAAQAHGQTYRGKRCGGFGDVSIFSFYPNKIIACGEGGMVLTDDEEFAERCRRIRNLCFLPERRFVHEELGSNFRMTNMQAALGCAQLENINNAIIHKREIGKFYRENLEAVSESFIQPLEKTEYCDNIYWIYGLVLRNTMMDGKQAMEILQKRGIGTRPFFYPVHKQPVFLKMGLFKDVKCPVSEELAKKGFYIPSGLGLTEEKMQRVVQVIVEEFGEKK
ncbi:MAG: DegT/DnrJ/EryC1/StrS family aminotransferase [Lachnospiraceae bacterium]|nr:DegT/DnrJ/EryC1/StrS family aminotransferase [Lachnospiraceae bacterium]